MSIPVVILCTLLAEVPPGIQREAKTELNFIPVVGGDSDVGLGLGAVGDLARLQPDYLPFRWRLEAAGFISFKPGQEPGQAVSIPFQDYFLLLAVPQLTSSGRLRLEVRPSFTDESTQRFYGVGNASPRPSDTLAVADTQYQRRHAALAVAARWSLGDQLFVRPQVDYTQNWVRARPTSILERERREGTPFVRSLLDGPANHGVAAAEVRLEYDSRDNEIVTREGSFHHLRLRASPRLGPQQPFSYGSADATLRVYRTPYDWLTVSGRLVGDVLFGDPPFYELTRVDDSSVVGGGKGIRGVPGQRYYGNVKVFANVETRTQVWSFSIKGKPFVLSTALFADGGRVWAELAQRHPELDGSGLDLKYGLGGGLRLQEGSTFIVRADVAWSPDAEPIGAYFNAGQMF
jgi:outer membrane protein assembly factor BamA